MLRYCVCNLKMISFIVVSILNVTFSLPNRPSAPALRVKRITNGDIADEGQFPFAVSLSAPNENSTYKHFCGGTLLKNDLGTSLWVISAAHCFLQIHNHSTVRVQVGGGDLSDNSIKHFEVDEIFKRNVNIYTYYNDIALLKLKTSADDDILQQQVILRAMETVESAECFIYGYGSLQLNGISSEKLYYGRVDLISLQECERIMGRVWAPSDNTGQFCALGRNGIDACNGDSGSGLVCKSSSGDLELWGITSYGMGCEGSAGVYQNVEYHRAWIENTMTKF